MQNMAIFQEITITLLTPLVNLWNGIVDIFPGLVAALLIIILGYFVALVISHAIRILIEKSKIDKALEKLDLPKAIGKFKVSGLIGVIAKWYIFIIFLQAAVDAINLGTMSVLLTQLVLWIPQLIVAVLTLFAGMFIAHYLSHNIEKHSEMKGSKLASKFFNWTIVFVSVVIALQQIGLEVSILENAFLILIASLGLGFALAIGLSFGLGTKDEAKEIISKIKKNF